MRGMIELRSVDSYVIFHQAQEFFRLCRVMEAEHCQIRARRFYKYYWILSPTSAIRSDNPEKIGISSEELRLPGLLISRKQYLCSP